MLYYCKQYTPVWKGLDGDDLYTRAGCVNEGETIIFITQDPETDYVNIMTPDGTIGWVSGYFFRNKSACQPVRMG